MRDTNLELQLMQRPDKSLFIKVQLRSDVRPGVIAQVSVDDQGAEDRTGQAVLAAGGALAEYLGRQYGDQLDADEVAREARELYRELITEMEQTVH